VLAGKSEAGRPVLIQRDDVCRPILQVGSWAHREEAMIDADGFTIHICSECNTPKMAALFTPREIEGRLRCRVCTGEMSRGHSKAHKPTEAQQPRAVLERLRTIHVRDSQ